MEIIHFVQYFLFSALVTAMNIPAVINMAFLSWVAMVVAGWVSVFNMLALLTTGKHGTDAT